MLLERHLRGTADAELLREQQGVHEFAADFLGEDLIYTLSGGRVVDHPGDVCVFAGKTAQGGVCRWCLCRRQPR